MGRLRPALAPLSAGLLLLWLAMLLLGGGEADRRLLLSLYAAEWPTAALIAVGFTNLGYAYSLIPITLVAAGWLFMRGRARDALLLLGATLSGRLMIFLEKLWFARVRPDENLRLVEVNDLSFPSAHAGNSMMVFLGIALLAFDEGKRRIAVAVALSLTFLIGISRSMLGVHWPSDVIGGWSFGAMWILLLYGIAPRTSDRMAA